MTYRVAGQAVAVRVSGDPDSANNGLFYLHSDHLGSASAMQKDGTTNVTQTRYLPFGGYRDGSGGNAITDRGYTGHKQNDGLGLIYMNARYYVPGIGRFASADTMVPEQSRQSALTVDFHETSLLKIIKDENKQLLDFGPYSTWNNQQKQEYGIPSGPTDPQALNRYSYVRNNPLNLVDPTGHVWVRINLDAAQAQQFVDYMLGTNGSIGFKESLYDNGQKGVWGGGAGSLITLSASAPPLAVAATILVALSGETLKETANTLGEIAELIQAELDAGTESISIEVEDQGFFSENGVGAKITVRGLSTNSVFAPALVDASGTYLKFWMFYTDNDAPVVASDFYSYYQHRYDDGSVNYFPVHYDKDIFEDRFRN